jgi:ATP synthase protein I
MQAEIRDQNATDAQKPSKSQGSSGFLSLSRVADLNDMDVDLSQQLLQKPKPLVPPRSAASRVPMRPVTRSGKSYSNPPTASEQRAWARSSGYQKRSGGGAPAAAPEIDEEQRAEEAMKAAQQYEKDKKEYQYWTTGTATVFFAIAYSCFSKVWCCCLLLPISS